MSNPELKLNIVTTTDTPDSSAPKLDRQKLAEDLKKRLDANKASIFANKSEVYGAQSTDYLTKQANKILETNLLKVGHTEINDGNEQYVIYYTGTDGRQYSLDTIWEWGSSVDVNSPMSIYFNAVFYEITNWLAEQKLRHLEQWKAGGDTWAASALDALWTDLAQIKKDMWKEIDFFLGNEIDDLITNQKQTTEQEIETNFSTLIAQAKDFSGDYNQMQQLDQQIAVQIDNISASLAGRTGSDRATYEQHQRDLEYARASLPDKYIDAVIKKHISTNPLTPKADVLPALNQEIIRALELIETELASLTGTTDPAQLARQTELLRKKTSLESSLSQLDVSTDDADALRTVERYTSALAQLRTGLHTINEATLTDRNDSLFTQRTTLEQEIATLKAKKLSPQTEVKLDLVLSNYTKAEEEFAKRIKLERARRELTDMEDKVAKMKREKARKKDIAELEELIGAKRLEVRDTMDELRGYVGVDGELVRDTPEIPSATIIQRRLQEGYDVKPAIDGKQVGVKTEEQLKQAYSGVLDTRQQDNLISQYLGKTLNRSKLWPLELQYMINYKQIQVNANNDSRAVQLDELTNMNREFNNLKIGTGGDMRIMAEDINRLLADEKVRAKYTKKAFQSAFTWALLEAYNKQNLMQIEYLMANDRGIPDMQQMPDFFTSQQVDVWWPPYYLGVVAQQWFWPQWRWSVKDIVGKKLYNKYLKNVSIIEPYLYPTELPGTNINSKPSRGGNAIMMKSEHGTREVIGETMTNETLLNLYLQSYESYDVTWGTLENKLTTDPKIGYNLVDRWLTEGMDIIGLIKVAYMKKGMNETEAWDKARVVGEQLIKDAFTYDDDLIFHIREEYHAQTDYYRAARERLDWHAITDRSVDKIPLDQKNRIMSRAAVQGLSRGFGHGQDAYGNIQRQLMQMYGWAREVPDQFVHNSNDKVGENMVRLIEDHKKAPGFALGARTMADFGSVDNFVDKVQTKGIFETWGEVGTTLMQQYMPWIPPEQAKMLWSGLGKVAKWAAVIWVVKSLYNRTKAGDGFWWKANRLATIGVGAYFFGKDIMALWFGGKWWWIASGLSNYLNKSKDYGKRGLSDQQMLSFTFGKQSLNDLFSLLEVKDGKFMITEGKMKQMFSGSNLAPDQQEAMKAMLWGSRDGMSNMIHDGLAGAGVTPENYKSVLATSWTKSVTEFMNGAALFSQQENLLADALGVDAQDPQFVEVHEMYKHLSAEQQKSFLERAEAMKTFGKTRDDLNTYMSSYLIDKRRVLLDMRFGAPVVDLWKAWFAQQDAVTDMRKLFIAGVAPFDGSTTVANNMFTFTNSMKTNIFGGDENIATFLQSSDVLADLKLLVDEGNPPFVDDEKAIVDLSTNTDTWFVNRMNATDPKKTYSEMFVRGVDKLGSDAFIGVKEGATTLPNGKKESFLVFWLPNEAGKREERQIDSIAGKALLTDGFGWVGTGGGTKEFSISLADGVAWSATYETAYAPQLLRSSMQAAKWGATEFDLSGREFSDPAQAKSGKVLMKKTGAVRWPATSSLAL
jgi:hypothetical protein